MSAYCSVVVSKQMIRKEIQTRRGIFSTVCISGQLLSECRVGQMQKLIHKWIE